MSGQEQMVTSTPEQSNNNDTTVRGQHYSRRLYNDYPDQVYIPSSPRLIPRMPTRLDLLQTEHDNSSWPTSRLNRNTAITETTT